MKNDEEVRRSTVKVVRDPRIRSLGAQLDSFVLEIAGVERIPLSREEEITLGRDLSCTIMLPFKDVSRIHAKIWWEDGDFFIEDCNSTNGVIVNGKTCKRAKLAPNDQIELGSTTLVLLKERKALT